MMNKNINKIIVSLFYIILLVIMLLRTSEAAPNIIVRVGYLILFFAPLIFKYRYLYLPLFVTFMTIGTYGFSYNFFPYMMVNYMILSIVILVFMRNLYQVNISGLWLFVILYVGIIDILHSGSLQDIFYSMVTVSIGMLLMTDRSPVFSTKVMMISFTVISLTMSTLYLLNYDLFIEMYSAEDSMERSGWTDPNYLSCIIGMGVITAMMMLMNTSPKDFVPRLYFLFVIIVSLIAQFLLASRGGLLCVAVAVFIYMLMSKVRMRTKVMFGFVLVLFTFWLYSNNYFDLLLYRIGEDTDGSGRLVIWTQKISSFYEQNDIGDWVFGVGHKAAFELGSNSTGVGFHNDFLAIMCAYGLVGLLCFIYLMFICPLKYTNKHSRSITVPLMLYLIVACMTLEPISAGRITYFAFYALIIFSNRNTCSI